MYGIKEYTEKIFEDLKHIDEKSIEYWYARELMAVLEYKELRKFDKVIKKAMKACDGNNYYIYDHFFSLRTKWLVLVQTQVEKFKIINYQDMLAI